MGSPIPDYLKGQDAAVKERPEGAEAEGQSEGGNRGREGQASCQPEGRKCDGRLHHLQAEHKDDQGQHSGQAARREQALGEEVRCLLPRILLKTKGTTMNKSASRDSLARKGTVSNDPRKTACTSPHQKFFSNILGIQGLLEILYFFPLA